MPGSNIGRTSDSPSNPGQYFRCNSINSVAIRTACAFESVFKIAQPPITSLASVKGPSVTVILPLVRRTRTPSLLGSRPPVSTRLPSLRDFSTNLPMASMSAAGGPDSRWDSEWRMKVRYFMAPPQGFQLYDERARVASTRQFFRCSRPGYRPSLSGHWGLSHEGYSFPRSSRISKLLFRLEQSMAAV